MALEGLPGHIVELLACAPLVEFASTSRAGVPIDTPLLLFPSDDMSTFDVGTGMAYPVKAERARHNPRVGMFIKGGPDDPVIAIAGIAAVRDRDVQDNTLRYIRETASYGWGNSQPWDVARQAIWYWSRIIIRTTPQRILWWDSMDAMDAAPQCWVAPADTVYLESDPAPSAQTSPAPGWPQPDWRDYRKSLLDQNAVGYLTTLDEEGFPLPIPARSITPTDDGFDLDMPAGASWIGPGKATLDFEGRATFIGDVTGTGAQTHLRFERLMPVMPQVSNPMETWLPEPDTRAAMMLRLQQELDRRGLSLPVIPAIKPEPTAGAIHRKASARRK